MGKHSVRNECKRKLEQARGNIGWAVNHLEWIPPIYSPTHPEISAPVVDMINVLKQLDELLSAIEEQV